MSRHIGQEVPRLRCVFEGHRQSMARYAGHLGNEFGTGNRSLAHLISQLDSFAGTGAAIHQAKCLVFLLLDQFVFEILLSTPAAKGQCRGDFDALLHLILRTELLGCFF